MLRLLKTMRAFARRLYWNRLFLENRQACLDSVMRDFAAFLRVGHEPSSEVRPQRTASPYGSAARRWDALGPVTVEGYVKMIRKLVKDAAEIFPRKKSIAEAIMRFHEEGRSYSHVRNFSIAAEWYMEFWGDPISLPRARKPARVVREFLEEDEVRTLLRACKTRRETALVATLAYSGLSCDLVTIQNQLGHGDIKVTRLRSVHAQDIPPAIRRFLSTDYLGEGRPSRSVEDSRLSRGAAPYGNKGKIKREGGGRSVYYAAI